VAGHDLVERVYERGGVERLERAAQGPGQPDLGEEGDASTGVALERRAVAEHEPPAFIPRLFGHGGQQAAGLIVIERQQRQLLAPVDPGDDTRRPTAELSGARVEEYGTRQLRLVGVLVHCHPREPTRLSPSAPPPAAASPVTR
jgi:hypothetical protein